MRRAIGAAPQIDPRSSIRTSGRSAEDQFELVAGTDAEIGCSVLGESPPALLVHETGTQGQDEVVGAVHATTDAIAMRGVDPGMAVHVVGVRTAPLRDEIVLAHEERGGRVAMADRPAEPAQHLIGEMGEPLGPIGGISGIGRCEQLLPDRLQPAAQIPPGRQLGGLGVS